MTDQKPTITLAQWCAYLPYGITVQSDQIREGYQTKLVASNPTNSFNNGFTLSGVQEYNAKPLLRRPHFDIEKIIDEAYNSKVNWRIRIDYDYTYNRFYNEDVTIEVEHLPNSVIQALLAAHYDIFGLIEQGLALPTE